MSTIRANITTTKEQQEEARVFSAEVLGKENVSAWYAWLHAEFKRKRKTK